MYQRAFAQLADAWTAPAAQVVSLGCGGGNKDRLLLRRFQKRGRKLHYLPCDISPALAGGAASAFRRFGGRAPCHPVVCDLAEALPLAALLARRQRRGVPRVILFLGVLPNMPPRWALRCLRAILRPGDTLAVSANLLPEGGGPATARRILAQYDNPETRDWLLALVRDLGLPRDPRHLRFEMRASPGSSSLKRVEAIWTFPRAAALEVEGRVLRFRRGQTLRLFFSNRHTPALLRDFLLRLGIPRPQTWRNASGEEAIMIGRVGGSRPPLNNMRNLSGRRLLG